MASTTLTADIIAKEALMILDNNLVMSKNVFRGYENEYDKKVNGYAIGDTLSIRKPTDFTIRSGATMAVQDTIEGKVQITVNQLQGVDFRFTSSDLTLKVEDLSERFIKPAMVQLANKIDADLMALFAKVPQWVGTPGQTVNSFGDYMLAPQQLDSFAVPGDERTSVLSPADFYGMLSGQVGLLNNNLVGEAYTSATLGNVAGVKTNMSQNVPTLLTGTRTGTTTAISGSVTTATLSYDTAKNTNAGLTSQTISLTNMGSATATVKNGEVFTIASVFAVNPVTKARLPFQKQFTVVGDFTAATSAITNFTFSPAMIWSGAFQNITTTNTDLNTLTLAFLGTSATNYPQNMAFHKNAFALVTVPMVSPPGAVDVSRQSYKGTNVRVIPVYDGVNDISAWRLDVLYGLQAIDHRLATRLSGT